MTGHIAQIWRHPIKAHGREAMVKARLEPGRALPFDRQWGVLHEAARLAQNADGWEECRNFSRGAGVPLLQAMEAHFDLPTGTVTLTHPKMPGLTINPDRPEDQTRFIKWVQHLTPAGRPKPTRVIKAKNAMTDSQTVSLSLMNLASHQAICSRVGRELSPLRWRGNLLVSGLFPWEERGWVGKHIRIGNAEFYIRKEITRCRMTEASTRTGERDANTLGALRDGWGIQEMGVHAVVTKGGEITVDDKIEVLE
ncbi:MOSC domain-containing protein [Aliiroseovarius crassostreae]|uniref:MOSC domain-containing protein n=1 Tax=Aliiroseovarius crassostreae TaxID=154981 RepID=UPI0021B08E72|nr:MOSC domain-containing protein [Aliiroseovarius crassostreae]UWP92553.1 MOSC domain-containing protein [Aliiroseovarius crassostreae]